VPSLDPTDVFPPRNLPGPAVPWGREVEGVATLLKGSAKNLRQSIESMNRSTAASLQSLGDQITTLSDQQARAAEQVTTYSFTQSVSKSSEGLSVPWSREAPDWASAAYVEVFAENVSNTLLNTAIYLLVGYSSPAWANGLINYTSLDVDVGEDVGPLVPTLQNSRVVSVRGGSADGYLHGLLEAYPSYGDTSSGSALVRITQIMIWIP